MEEIAGADATYVDPLDVASIRAGIARGLRARRRAASRRGRRSRAATRAVYEEVA